MLMRKDRRRMTLTSSRSMKFYRCPFIVVKFIVKRREMESDNEYLLRENCNGWSGSNNLNELHFKVFKGAKKDNWCEIKLILSSKKALQIYLNLIQTNKPAPEFFKQIEHPNILLIKKLLNKPWHSHISQRISNLDPSL